MNAYEKAKKIMDARVDNNLGDSIWYAVDGVTFVKVYAFLRLRGDGNSFDGVQPLKQRWQLKIAKNLLPAGGPTKAHRIKATQLGVIPYRPAASIDADTGDYLIFDIIKAG